MPLPHVLFCERWVNTRFRSAWNTVKQFRHRDVDSRQEMTPILRAAFSVPRITHKLYASGGRGVYRNKGHKIFDAGTTDFRKRTSFPKEGGVSRVPRLKDPGVTSDGEQRFAPKNKDSTSKEKPFLGQK